MLSIPDREDGHHYRRVCFGFCGLVLKLRGNNPMVCDSVTGRVAIALLMITETEHNISSGWDGSTLPHAMTLPT
jgi:hypothetical protein